MKFIPEAGSKRSGRAGGAAFIRGRENGSNDRVQASLAREHQIFVERGLESSRVGNAKNGIGRLDVVGDAEARFCLTSSRQPVIQIAANSQVERPISLRDRVLYVERELFHVRVAVKCEQATSLRQVEGKQDGALRNGGIRAAEGGKKRRVNDSKGVVLRKERLF